MPLYRSDGDRLVPLDDKPVDIPLFTRQAPSPVIRCWRPRFLLRLLVVGNARAVPRILRQWVFGYRAKKARRSLVFTRIER